MLHQECTTGSTSSKKGHVITTQPEWKNNDSAIGEEASSSLLQAKPKESVEDSGRERLKRHRVEAAGRVRIPEIWGQENFLKEWVDCSAFDSSLVPNGVVSAREALVEECQRI